MLKHMYKAFFYSTSGLAAAAKEEIAFRLVLIQALFIAILVFNFPLEYHERAFLLFSAFICIIVELINSAIENTVDITTQEWHILAKKAKDMGSAAQFVALISLYLQLMLIFLNK